MNYLIKKITSSILKVFPHDNSIFYGISDERKTLILKEIIKIFFNNHILPFYSEKITLILKEVLFLKNADELLNEIRELNKKEMFFYLHNRKVFDEFLKSIKGSSIEIIILKGIVLEELLYDGVLRPSVDFDILVRREDKKKVGKILKSLDFAIKQDGNVHIRWAKENHNFSTVIEVHTSLIREDFFFIDEEKLFQDSISFKGKKIRRLSNEDLLIHLFIHLARSCFKCPLKNLLDIHLFLSRFNLNWNLVLEKLNDIKANTLAYLCLSIVQKRFGTKIDDKFIEKLKPSFFRRIYLEHFLEFEGEKVYKYDHPQIITKLIFLLPLMDDNMQRLKLIINFLKRRSIC